MIRAFRVLIHIYLRIFTILQLFVRKFGLLKTKMPKKRVFLHKGVPYFSQWESRELVKDITSRKISAKDDPLWKKSGAEYPEEYELWSWNGCGMACLKMILVYKFGKNIPLVKLGKRCLKFGGYISRRNGLDGLYYKPFLDYIKEDFGLTGKTVSPMYLEDILRELNDGSFVIASVSARIKYPNSIPRKRGGHLVLLLGYNIPQGRLFLHNPSGITLTTQEYAQISFEDFNKFFACRGISIS